MKKIITTLFIACLALATQAQTIQYDYDAAGNRILRYALSNKPANTTETETLLIEEDLELSQEDMSKLLIFPNPTKGELRIDSPDTPNDAQVYLYDASGKQVYQSRFGDGYFDLSKLAVGTYVLMLRDGEKVRHTKLIRSY